MRHTGGQTPTRQLRNNGHRRESLSRPLLRASLPNVDVHMLRIPFWKRPFHLDLFGRKGKRLTR